MSVAPKVCPECSGLTKPLTPPSNPLASEFYCETCHKSYLMESEQEINFWMSLMPAR